MGQYYCPVHRGVRMRLDGITILDLTQLLPGPYATQLLVDQGAEVIKIEHPVKGDAGRNVPPTTPDGEGAIFHQVNRGKKSVTIDLKTQLGKDVFYALVSDADVVFVQFRPGVVDRLEIDYPTLRKHNEQLIYCSLTGFHPDGPHGERAGHDLNYCGVAGLLDMTRSDETMPPQIPGYPVADLSGGLFAAFAIVGGLLSRELGEESGEYISVGMADVLTSFAHPVAYDALTEGNPRPGATELTGAFPWYDIYECANGRYLTLAALEPQFWEAFCEAIDRDDLRNEHAVTDPARREALYEELVNIFSRKPRETWMDELGPETATAPVLTPAEALNADHLAASGIISSQHSIPFIGFPATGSDLQMEAAQDVPDLGEHTVEVLTRAGVPPSEIEQLRDEEIIE